MISVKEDSELLRLTPKTDFPHPIFKNEYYR